MKIEIEINDTELEQMVTEKIADALAEKYQRTYSSDRRIVYNTVKECVREIIYKDKPEIIERIIRQAVPEMKRTAVKRFMDELKEE